MPGLVDCHIHAEQIMNAGANYDKTFFQWLVEDFDPTSQQFATNQTYARNAAPLIVVRKLLFHLGGSHSLICFAVSNVALFILSF